MTPAVPPLPTIWNLPFQPSLGIHTSNCTAGVVTPTTRQIGAAIVPTGFGFTPAGSISVSVIVVSAMLSLVLRSEQAMGFAASDGVATSAPDTAMAEKNAQSGTRTRFVCWRLEIGRAQSELQSLRHLVCRLLLEKKKNNTNATTTYACDCSYQKIT